MFIEIMLAYIFCCFITFIAVKHTIGKVESRFMRVFLKSLVFSLCTALTILPNVLTPSLEASMPVPSPVIVAVIIHIGTMPESFSEFALNWYLYPFCFWWFVCFSWGYLMSVAVDRNPEKNMKQGEGQWF